MATNACSSVDFFWITDTAFYFQEAVKDVDEDKYLKSSYPIIQNWIKSKDNKFLLLNTEEQFQAQNLTTEQQQCHPEYKFNIQFYKDSIEGKVGRAVMLYANKDGKKMVVCCNEKHEIHPVEMNLPHHIGENAHKAVFYRIERATSRYMFESSFYPSEFLGFEPDGDDHTLSKLVLRYIGKDEVDESCDVILSQ